MKKKIYIVELYNHHEVVRALYILYSTAGFEVSIFAEKNVVEHLGDHQATLFIKSKKESQIEFINRNIPQLNLADVVLYTTLVKNVNYFSKLRLIPPTILLIHDGNYFLAPNKSIKINSLKDIARWLKFIIFFENKHRQKLLRNVSYISFADDFISAALAKEIKNKNLLVLPSLPLSFYENHTAPTKKPLRIIIPGSIQCTRNYELVFSAFWEIRLQISKPIEIILLGGGHSKFANKMINQFKQLTSKQIKIISQNHPFSQKKYDEHLAQASFAIIPIKRIFKGGLFSEEYGKTKITGSINDVIRFGIPTLISSHYPYPIGLMKMFSHFSNASELASLIKDQLNNETKPIFQELENYSLKERSKKLNFLMQVVLKKAKLQSLE